MPVSRRELLGAIAAGTSLVITERTGRAAPSPPQSARHWTPNWISGQPEIHPSPNAPVSLQPLADHVRQIETALDYLGQPFAPSDRDRINAAIAMTDESAAIEALQQILDRHALITVTINPESRVAATR